MLIGDPVRVGVSTAIISLRLNDRSPHQAGFPETGRYEVLRGDSPGCCSSHPGLSTMKLRLFFATSIFLADIVTIYANDRTPIAFVRALCRDYGKDDRLDYLEALASRFFAPRLLELIRSDERVPSGDIGKLDEDPLCDCQDGGGFRLSAIMIDRLSADRVNAKVSFSIGAFPKMITLDLVKIGGEWRIADVHAQRMPSLVSFLDGTGARPQRRCQGGCPPSCCNLWSAGFPEADRREFLGEDHAVISRSSIYRHAGRGATRAPPHPRSLS